MKTFHSSLSRWVAMQLPYFYIEPSLSSLPEIVLDEENSRHIIQVLRMRNGERMHLTDGMGTLIKAEITGEHKKHCKVTVIERNSLDRRKKNITVAISLLKNSSRFEWFLEKATEIGVTQIIPLICERTERQKFRIDRLKAILVSAMLQSEQCWLPILSEPVKFEELINCKAKTNLIAHCIQSEKKTISPVNGTTLIAIGPEGDFSPKEIDWALGNEFLPVSLGETRLRTETAGIVAAATLCL